MKENSFINKSNPKWSGSKVKVLASDKKVSSCQERFSVVPSVYYGIPVNFCRESLLFFKSET